MRGILLLKNGGNMFVIVVYDMESDRTRLPRKFLRRYLEHVQYSVFEGEVTEGEAAKIEDYLEENVKDDETIIIYKLDSENYMDRKYFGEDKGRDDRKLL
jgi:CRISPR-associated protein Cas2